MPARERKLSKNYIGILSDQVEEQRTESLPKSDGPTKDYLFGLMAAVLLFQTRPSVFTLLRGAGSQTLISPGSAVHHAARKRRVAQHPRLS
jgi:hypothetical protein